MKSPYVFQTTIRLGRILGLVSLTTIGGLSTLAIFSPRSALALESSPQATCELTVRRADELKPRIDLRVGDRRISVLGWDHLSPWQGEINARDQLFEAALSAAEFNKCDETATHLTTLFGLLSDEVTRGTQLWKDLQDVDDEFHLDAVGLELTPQEQVQFWVKNAGKADGFNTMKRMCPLTTKALANPLRFALPGPIYLFQSQKAKTVRLEFLEDAAIKARAIAEYEKMNALMPLHSDSLPEAAQMKFDEFQGRIGRGESLSDQDVNDFITDFGATPVGAKVGKFLSLLKRLLDLSPLRNEAIAKNALVGKGNTAITIGRSHVRDVAEKILEKCQAQNARAGLK